jgi:formate dehydrogenase iron-sulfur subunit
MGTRALPIVSQSAAPAMQGAAPNASKQEPMGFFTDTSVCIGCKACEVACKEWNQLPARGDGGAHLEMSGMSYDNTLRLSGDT